MEPIEEYLRNLHRKNNSSTSQSSFPSKEEEPEAPEPLNKQSPDAANAPTTELPTVVAALRKNEPEGTQKQGTRKQASRTQPTRRKRRTQKRPRRYDLIIMAAGVVLVAVIVVLAFVPRGSEQTVAQSAPSGSEKRPTHEESAHDAVIRLCNERALAFSTADEKLLRSLTADGSPARQAEKFDDLHKYGGVDIAIDATDIDVVSETNDSAVVTATVTAHPEKGVRLTLTLKKVDKRWRVWEVTE
ncbi:hypothetical protein HMPREF0183_1639 [Brevibacterium mcbrellneri ATCC 49030]|uniref:Uncharacterized protein n=2 Tax=Brevibacterium TaxID=1696 RepID=D4YNX9_9MICO|nr:hypothetical protein HMPREF0183_1639 [Brevibacterium mcbrellneri ATCC 49030]